MQREHLRRGSLWIEVEPHQQGGRPPPIQWAPAPVRFTVPQVLEAISGAFAGMSDEPSLMASETCRCGCAGTGG